MKKFVVILVVLASIVAFSYSQALETKWYNRSMDIAKRTIGTESAAIDTGAGVFYGIIVRTDGTNNVTLNVYDSGSATGTRLTPANIVISGTSYQSGWSLSLDPPITYTTGLYVDVSVAGGGSCAYEVLYFDLP